MEGAPFDTTVAACGTGPPFAIAGVPEVAFAPKRLEIFLPPQAPVIATTFTYRVGRHYGRYAPQIYLVSSLTLLESYRKSSGMGVIGTLGIGRLG